MVSEDEDREELRLALARAASGYEKARAEFDARAAAVKAAGEQEAERRKAAAEKLKALTSKKNHAGSALRVAHEARGRLLAEFCPRELLLERDRLAGLARGLAREEADREARVSHAEHRLQAQRDELGRKAAQKEADVCGDMLAQKIAERKEAERQLARVQSKLDAALARALSLKVAPAEAAG